MSATRRMGIREVKITKGKSTLDNIDLIRQAYVLATKSPDPSTQIGSFLVSANGQVETLTQSYNQPTKGWKMVDSDWERPRKYDLLCHAERGALDLAATYGICTAGATMVATWAACADCSRGIVSCGIKRLIRHKATGVIATTGWEDSVSIGDQIMRIGGVELIDVIGPIPGAPDVMRSGALYRPANDLVNR